MAVTGRPPTCMRQRRGLASGRSTPRRPGLRTSAPRGWALRQQHPRHRRDLCQRDRLVHLRNTPDPEDQSMVIFDYDRLVFAGERTEAKAIVKTVRRLEATVRNGLARYDEAGIF